MQLSVTNALIKLGFYIKENTPHINYKLNPLTVLKKLFVYSLTNKKILALWEPVRLLTFSKVVYIVTTTR